MIQRIRKTIVYSMFFYYLIISAIVSFAAHIEIKNFQFSPDRQKKFNEAYVQFREEGISQSAPKGIKVESLSVDDIRNFVLLEDLSAESLYSGLRLMQHSAILISAAGQANRLAKQLGKKVPKALIKMNDGLAYDEGERGITFLEFQLRQLVEVKQKFQINVPVIIWTSETTHDEIVNFLKSHNFFGLEDVVVLGFQENVYGLKSGTTQEEWEMDPIGLGHGEVFRALRNSKFKSEGLEKEISVLDMLKTKGITHILFTNIEGAIGLNPLTFSQINPQVEMSVFVVPKLQGDAGGGAYRVYQEDGSYSIVIIEDMDKPKDVQPANDFNTNSIVFRLDIVERYPQLLELPISFEQNKEVLNQRGQHFRVTLGKTCIAQATYYLRNVEIIKGPRLATSDNRYTIYEHMKNLEQIKSNAPLVLQVHNKNLFETILRKYFKLLTCPNAFLLGETK